MPPAFCLYGEPFIGRVYRSLFAVCQTPEPAAILVSVPAIPVSVPAIPIPVSAVRPLRARCPSFIFPVLPRFRTIRLSAVFCRFSPLLTTSHLLLSRYLRHSPALLGFGPDTGPIPALHSVPVQLLKLVQLHEKTVPACAGTVRKVVCVFTPRQPQPRDAS